MTQASLSIANGAGAAVRAAINDALIALVTHNSGGTAPSPTYQYMLWADTANDLLKQRNAANSAWIIKGTLSASYGGLPASSIVYAPGSPALIDATNVQDALDALASAAPDTSFRGARVRLSAGETIATGTNTEIPWDAEDVDTDDIWSAGSPKRLTVPSGVTRVRLSFNLVWAVSSAGYRYVEVRKNGAAFAGTAAEINSAPSGALGTYQNGHSAVISVTAGDYFELRVLQSTGGNLDVTHGDYTWFEMEIIE